MAPRGGNNPFKLREMNFCSSTKSHVSKNQVYHHVNKGPEIGCSPANLYPNTAPNAIHKGSLPNEDLLDFSLRNIHIHWKT